MFPTFSVMESPASSTDATTSTTPAVVETKPAAVVRRTDYTFDVMREEHLEETCELIFLSFSTTNPLWRKISPDREVLIPYLRYRLTPAIATGTSSIMLLDGKIVAC